MCLYVCVYVCVDEGGAEKLRSARARVRARHACARKSMYVTSMYARYVSNSNICLARNHMRERDKETKSMCVTHMYYLEHASIYFNFRVCIIWNPQVCVSYLLQNSFRLFFCM